MADRVVHGDRVAVAYTGKFQLSTPSPYAAHRRATCPKVAGHVPPEPGCACGIYAVADPGGLHHFARLMETRNNDGTAVGAVPVLFSGILHAPVPAPPEPFRLGGPRPDEVPDPPGTYRGSAWTITGAVTTFPPAAALLRGQLGIDVRMVRGLTLHLTRGPRAH